MKTADQINPRPDSSNEHLTFEHFAGPRKGVVNVNEDLAHWESYNARKRKTRVKPTYSQAQEDKDKAIIEGWRDDPRMVFLANPGRDLTAKEREEWERSIQRYQIYYYPPRYKK